MNISHLSDEVCHNMFFSRPLISASCGFSSSGNYPHFSATGMKLAFPVDAEPNTWTSHVSPVPCLGLCHGVLVAPRTTKPACVRLWGVGEAAANVSVRQRASQLPAWGVLLSHVPPSPAVGLANRLQSRPFLQESQPRSNAPVREIGLIREE